MMYKYKNHSLIVIFIILLFSTISFAKVKFEKVPEREELQIIIYGADLSLIQEKRSILLKKGINSIEFSWEDVALDPATIYFMALTDPHLVSLKRTIYPIGGKYLIWEVDSKKEGKELIKASYYLQGLSWSSKYFIFVDEDGKELRLENYATINNRSGDEFEDATVSLFLGDIHRARRFLPMKEEVFEERRLMLKRAIEPEEAREVAFERRELAEYYTYKLKEKLTIKDKKMVETLLLYKDKIPFNKRYYVDAVIGRSHPTLFYEFKNELNEPLPPGIAQIYKLYKDKDMYLLGEDNIAYIPQKEEVKLNIGKAKDVIVEKKQISEKRVNEKYDKDNRLVKYDIDKGYKIVVTNRKKEGIKLFIKDGIEHRDWTMINCNHPYERIDVHTIQFELDLKPEEKREINYKVRLHY